MTKGFTSNHACDNKTAYYSVATLCLYASHAHFTFTVLSTNWIDGNDSTLFDAKEIGPTGPCNVFFKLTNGPSRMSSLPTVKVSLKSSFENWEFFVELSSQNAKLIHPPPPNNIITLSSCLINKTLHVLSLPPQLPVCVCSS